MSAPKTNLDTQKRRHIGPLIGIALSLIFVGGLILWWQYEVAAQNKAKESEMPEVEQTPATDPVPAAPVPSD